MNALILLLLVGSCAQSSYGYKYKDTVKEVNEVRELCVTQNNLSRPKTDTIWVPGDVSEDDGDIQSFFQCLFKKLGMADSFNQVNYDNLKKYVPAFIEIVFGEGTDVDKLTEGVMNNCMSLMEQVQVVPKQFVKLRNCGSAYVQSNIFE
uniref:Uncharacterized protein n=1 Tax=Photinus pyralis TaxID=7054 RepID=A0A1Y1MCM2_PHOPY